MVEFAEDVGSGGIHWVAIGREEFLWRLTVEGLRTMSGVNGGFQTERERSGGLGVSPGIRASHPEVRVSHPNSALTENGRASLFTPKGFCHLYSSCIRECKKKTYI